MRGVTPASQNFFILVKKKRKSNKDITSALFFFLLFLFFFKQSINSIDINPLKKLKRNKENYVQGGERLE